MKILIFSDSHGNESKIKEICDHQKGTYDYVFHLGDGARGFDNLSSLYDVPFVGVRGNCDFFDKNIMTTRILDLDGVRILLTHGHEFGVKGTTENLISYARQNNCQIALYGHTHTPENTYLPSDDENLPLYLFNPGSITLPNSGIPTYGTLNISKSGILFNIAKAL